MLDRISTALFVVPFGLSASAMSIEIEAGNWALAFLHAAFALFYADLAWRNICHD